MTKTTYHVDPQFLRGSETVLWASYGMEPKKPYKLRKNNKYVKALGVVAALCFAVINAYTASKMSVSFLEYLSSPRVLPWAITFGVGCLMVLSIFRFAERKYGLEKKAMKFASKIPQTYSAAMITDERLVLFDGDLTKDYDFRAGNIGAALYDYCRGGRVIKLELVPSIDVRTVKIASTRDLALAKQLIEDRFIRGGKMFRAHGALA